LSRKPRPVAAAPAQPIELAVPSEVGRLRKVMVHRPGRELDRMLPSLMDELLFDDIAHGPAARREHDTFRAVLGLVADEVLEIQDLLAETLLDGEVRNDFVRSLAFQEKPPRDIVDALDAMDAAELARVCVEGIEQGRPETHHRPWNPFALAPVPNLLFVRDPLVVTSHGAIVCSMAKRARRREPLIMKSVYTHHPRFRLKDRERVYFDDLSLEWLRRRIRIPGLEGGDVLVLSDRILAIGASERTNEVAVDLLTEALVSQTDIEFVMLVLMPKTRSAMHLDTIFTQISEHECLVYPPMFLPESPELLPVIKKDLRGQHIRSEFKPSLLEALREEGMDLEPVCCGGDDPVAQQREQWTDGANAFCLAPGIIVLYERNERTAEELSKRGYEVVHAAELLDGTRKLDLDGTHKYCILVLCPELSRARGGPRCMTMPIVRDGM